MIEVSHPDRIVFPGPGHTKRDIVSYYERAAPKLLPHLVSRPITILRFPRGIDAPGVFVKNAPKHYPPTFERIELPRKDGVTSHVSVRDGEQLAYLANQGAIELHVPTVRAPDLFHPDRIVVDLDPPPGEVALVRRAARAVRETLEQLGLPTVPVATGSKGYHLVAPIVPTVELSRIEGAMHRLATLAAAEHPELLTTTFRIAKRGGRVFFDWLRNRYGATVVCPFSLRARASAPVAMPITWEEIDSVAPDGIGLADVDAHLAKSDPLAVLAESPRDPEPFVSRVEAAFEASGLVLETFDRFRD